MAKRIDRGTKTMKAPIAACAFALTAAGLASPAGAVSNHYNVAISAGATGNVAFSNGIYSPTAPHAVLNVGDLESALAAGNVEVTTGNGTGGKQAGDLTVAAAFNWASGHSLTLDAYHSVTVNGSVADNGTGAVTLTTNDGGTDGMLSFGPKGSLSFLGTSDALTINGQAYTLVNSIATLAGGIAANASGHYALAASYDASQDGTYASAPIPTTFTGTLEGLGNTFKRLGITNGALGAPLGLFAVVDAGGSISSLRLVDAHIRANGRRSYAAALVAENSGTLIGDMSSGLVEAAKMSDVGGLAGVDSGGLIQSSSSSAAITILATGSDPAGGFAGGLVGYLSTQAGSEILNSSASGTVATAIPAWVGGLVGRSYGIVSGSFATGAVTGGENAEVGGLMGEADGGPTTNSYAAGAVTAGVGADVGGFIGFEDFVVVSDSYSTGTVSGGSNSQVGGFAGTGSGNGTENYWDTTTSGTDVGNGSGDENGLTGLTTLQLKSGLPAGFDPAIWAEKANANNGLPYLIANPPG